MKKEIGGQLPAHLLAFNIELAIKTRLKQLHVAKPAQVAAELAAQIVADEIPTEAFDPISLEARGIIVYQAGFDESTCKALVEEILQAHYNIADKRVPISILMSSEGGNVFDGLAIVSAMQHVRRFGRKVNLHVSGCAMSMASIALQGADLRTIDPLGWLMLHQSWDADASGLKTPDARDLVNASERLDRQACTLFAQRSGKSTSYWHRKIDRRDLYLSAEDALSEGLVDRILPTPRYK